jgi:hypothetical protein
MPSVLPVSLSLWDAPRMLRFIKDRYLVPGKG